MDWMVSESFYSVDFIFDKRTIGHVTIERGRLQIHSKSGHLVMSAREVPRSFYSFQGSCGILYRKP